MNIDRGSYLSASTETPPDAHLLYLDLSPNIFELHNYETKKWVKHSKAFDPSFALFFFSTQPGCNSSFDCCCVLQSGQLKTRVSCHQGSASQQTGFSMQSICTTSLKFFACSQAAQYNQTWPLEQACKNSPGLDTQIS